MKTLEAFLFGTMSWLSTDSHLPVVMCLCKNLTTVFAIHCLGRSVLISLQIFIFAVRKLWPPWIILDWGYESLSWFGTGNWSLMQPRSKFWLSVLIFKVQRTSMSFTSSFDTLEDAGGFWLGFGILILIWIWSLVFGTPIFRILALYLDFEGAKNIHVL